MRLSAFFAGFRGGETRSRHGKNRRQNNPKQKRLQGKYERVGTAPIVVWERENGDTEVITGRHRLDLARRSGEKSIPAYVVREADGFTVDDARTFDAESNIRDGMGTVRDYAHFFRNKDIDEAEASGKGLLSREKGKRGWAIGKFAEDNLYWLYRNGGISEERAAAVARGAPNDADVQKAALDSAKGMDATTLEIHTRRLKAFKDESGGNASGEAVQGDLFGVDDSAMREMVALSKAAGELVKQNKQRILAVKGVIKRPEIAREMGVDINNPDAVRAAVAALEYENSRLMSPTPEPEIMDKIRKKAGLFDKAENGENVEQGAGVEAQEDTGGLFDDGTAEMSFKGAVKRNPTVLEKLVSAPPVSIAADAYKGKYELNAKSAFRYVMDNLRGKKYTILDTGEQVEIGQVGAKKLTSHARYTEDYLQSFVAIPDIIESGIFLGEEENVKGDKKYDKYRYYACGLKIGNEDYTVRFTVGKRNGNWYYDQALTKIEKGELIERVRKQISLSSVNNSPYGFVDNRLLELLQEKNSEDNYRASFGAKNRRAEIEKTNRDFRELYERYKNGDQAAYEEAAKLVANYAESKGYDVKVYHGTGADGFNVAKADASEAQNGEGTQNLGMGVYLAVTKSTAEGYRKRARKTPRKLVFFDREKYEYVPIGFDKLSERTQKYLEENPKEWKGKTLAELEEYLKKKETEGDGALVRLFFPNGDFPLSEVVPALKEFIPFIKNNKLEPTSFATQGGEGKVFDWFTNLNEDNTLESDLPFSKQNAEVKKKLGKFFEDNGIDLREFLAKLEKKSYDIGSPHGWRIYRGIQSELAHGSAVEASRLLSEYGIRGITYDGGWDGRCYVSFEGGSVVKLQDPFTFDDNGELIPLSERFDEGNPDMRYSRGASGKSSSGGNVGGGVSFGSMVEEYAKLRELREKTVGEKPLTFVRPVSAMRSALPKSVRFNKASNRLEGVPSIGDIRRYMERVFNVPIANGLRKEVRQRGALGVYYNRLEAIRTLRGHINDLDTVAHELGHYLETLFFGGKLASEEAKNLELAKELEDYCIERFGEFTYKGRERISEGWAQFISDVIKGDETVADRCPRAFSALNSALRESPRVNEAFGFICQMAELNANASPLQRVNANIRRRSDGVRKTAVDRLIESGRWFTRMWFDEYEGLERFQRDLERSGVNEEDGSRVIDLARNYAGGSVGQVNYSLTVNQIDLDGRIVGKSLRAILRDNLKTAYDKENIDAYLMCRRVVEYYKTEERRGERGGSRSKFGIDYADAVDVVSTATDGMRKCAEELLYFYRQVSRRFASYYQRSAH